MTRDEIRTAGLLFGEELALGLIDPEALRSAEVQRAVRGQGIPSAFSRRYQRRQMERGKLTYLEHVVEPAMVARRALLGDEAAHGRPKLLVRVDAFPHPDVWQDADGVGTERAAAVHALLHDARVPYLMSVVPRVPRLPLDPGVDESRTHDSEEHALLAQMRRDGVSFGMNGLDHRTRSRKVAKRSEFTGGKHKAIAQRLDSALQTLRDDALHADVFVPPYDRFDPKCWPALASRFDVVCGGPQSVDTMGFHRTPSWRGDAVWLPAYPPLYGTAAQVLPAVQALAEAGTGLWIPVVLHWGDELADDLHALARLAVVMGDGELARSWEDFLLAVRASRQLAKALDR